MSALAGMASDSGGNIVFPAHYRASAPAERGRMFASFACFSAAVGTLLGVLILVGWSWRHALLAPDALDAASPLAVALTAAMMPLRAISMATTTMFSAGGRGLAIALQLAVQAIVNFVTAVLCLFVLDLHVMALFLGAFAGLASSVAVSLGDPAPQLRRPCAIAPVARAGQGRRSHVGGHRSSRRHPQRARKRDPSAHVRSGLRRLLGSRAALP